MEKKKKGRGLGVNAVKQAPTTGWLGGLAPSKANKKTVGFTHRRGEEGEGASNAYAWASLYLPPQHGFSLGASSARRIVAQP